MKKTFGVVVVIALVLLAGCAGNTSSPDQKSTGTVGDKTDTVREETQTPTGNSTTESPSKTQSTAASQTTTTDYTRTATETVREPTDSEATESPVSGTNYTVTEYDVRDGGDVIIVKFDNGSQQAVELHGVEAPETSTAEITPEAFDMPPTDAARNWLYRWGHKSREYGETQLDDERITIVVYGHTATGTPTVYLYYGSNQNTLYNMNLLKKGYARTTETAPAHPLSEEFAAAEGGAREDTKGVWAFNESQNDLSRA